MTPTGSGRSSAVSGGEHWRIKSSSEGHSINEKKRSVESESGNGNGITYL